MNSPFFTVIIPTYHRAKLLQESIQSVLIQTFKDYELIVIDDNSMDDTRKIVESFCDYRIKYIINDHTQGSSGARNAGILRAKGKWIAFLDDDDTWISNKLELQYDVIQKIDSSVGMIYGGLAIYDYENNLELSVKLPEKEGWIQRDLLYDNCIASFGSVAIRKDILLSIGGFDESFPAVQDWELYVRVTAISQVVSIKQKLYYVRMSNSDRITFNLEKKLTGVLLFRNKYYSLLKNSPILCHHIASKIFIYSLRVHNWSIALRYFPWTIAGIFFSPYNLTKTMWGVFLILIRSKRIGNKVGQ